MMQSMHEIMFHRPAVICVDQSLAEAAERMEALDVGALPVVDGDELVGMVTDRDLVVRGMARGADPASVPVFDMMTRPIVFCHWQTPIGVAASLMAQERVRRLAVVDGERELVGVVSLSDMARVDDSGMNIAAAVARVISVPTNTAKTPAGGYPTGGRARRSPAGILPNHSPRPRIPRRASPSGVVGPAKRRRLRPPR